MTVTDDEDGNQLVNQGKDGRPVDFVLVWEEDFADPKWNDYKEMRTIFMQNLRHEGLIVEEVDNGGSKDLRFVTISAPLEVLCRYAEILKIRLPIRKFSAEMLHSESAEGANMLEFKLSNIDGSAFEHSMMGIPLFSDVHDELKSWFEKLQEPFYPDDKVFQRRGHQHTAIYSRDKEYLFDVSDPDFFTPAQRSRIVEFLLSRKRFSDDEDLDFAFGVAKLINDGAAVACYPLHDGDLSSKGSQRHILYHEWASLTNFWKYQPLDAIRNYFGVKIGLYFAWLGFYTSMLIPPSIVGIVCFIYGLSTVSNDIPTNDICEGEMKDVRMCPTCDEFCGYETLQQSCRMIQAKYLFDNGASVFFAWFMSLWSVVFIEFWKRYSAEITHRWNVFGYDPDEEHPRPEYLAQLANVKERRINYVTQTSEPKPPFWNKKFPGIVISWSSVIFFIVLALVTVMGIILYRMSMAVVLATIPDNNIKSNWSLFISISGASINLVLILIFNYIYEFVAVWLTEKELHRSQTSFDDALTLKIYLFQFVNYYASIIYIAFFKGQFIGTPNKYTRFFNVRQEECSPGGCFVELSIQLATIFMGKQFLLSVVEYYLPLMWRAINWLKHMGMNLKKGELRDIPQYVKDFRLLNWSHQALFYEYLEMVIQYGFITIFVSAFPLAPFFALLNNILEIRLDAKKVLIQHRRPIAQKVQCIGVWLDIMETLGRISIITNAFIIALTSEIIPKLVYRNFYSSDGSLTGYVNFTLAYFDMKDLDPLSKIYLNETEIDTTCRYADYKSPASDSVPYEHNTKFWHIWFARLLFVVMFENIVAVTAMFLKFAIPDIPADLKYKIRREEYITKEIVIRTERLKKTGKLKSKFSSSNPEMSPSKEIHEKISADDIQLEIHKEVP